MMKIDLPHKALLPLSERANSLTAPGTSTMRSKANALKESGVHIVNFAAGELSFDACPMMKVGASYAIDNCCNRYTPPLGLPQLRTALAEKTSQRCNTVYTAGNIAVTAGGKQALFNAALLVLNQGDEVIVPVPFWETLPTQVRLAQATPILVDTSPDNYRLTYKAIEHAVTNHTKMIVINTPNNPTGSVYQPDELLKIAMLAYERNIWILFDECYREFVSEPYRHYNIVELFEPIKQQTILIDSFSKSHAVTGWRLGYACAPSHVISAMHNLQGHTTSNPNRLAQHAALFALKDGSTDFLLNINHFLSQQRDAAISYLDSLADIHYAAPEGAFYLYLDVSRIFNRYYCGRLIDNVDTLAELLLTEAHVAVVPGTGSGDPNSIRMTYSVESDDLKMGMEQFRDFIQALSAQRVIVDHKLAAVTGKTT